MFLYRMARVGSQSESGVWRMKAVGFRRTSRWDQSPSTVRKAFVLHWPNWVQPPAPHMVL